MATGTLNSYRYVERIPELDLLKSLALVLMAWYHLMYDLKEFANIPIDYQAPFWHTLQQTSAMLFIFISGISSGLSRNPLRHGLRVLTYGLMITVITYIAMPEQYVRFGILHFLGVATLILFILRRQKAYVLITLAFSAALIGLYLKEVYLPTSLLLPLGVKYRQFSSIDYFPIFPYLSISILGFYTYRLLYVNPRKANPDFFQLRRVPTLVLISSSLGKHSLLIYLLHQPLFLGIIFMILALTR